MKTHTREKLIIAISVICAFSLNDKLKKIRMHIRKKTLKCTKCDIYFNNNGSHQKHKVHAGIKLISVDIMARHSHKIEII